MIDATGVAIDDGLPSHINFPGEGNSPHIDAEFDALVAYWGDEYGEVDQTQLLLDRLVQTRSAIANLQADELRVLAELEAIALCPAGTDSTTADPLTACRSREIAWRSMVAEVSVATRLSDRSVQAMLGRATALVTTLPETMHALHQGTISLGHARTILEHSTGIDGAAALAQYERVVVARAKETTPGKTASTAKITNARLRAASFEQRHTTAREGRQVSIRDLDDGMSELIHLLPTPYAAAIFDRLTRQANAVKLAATPTSKNTDPRSIDLRSIDQLRSDIATELLLTGEPACGPDAPHSAAEAIRAQVSIVIPALTLLGHDTQPATLTGHGPIDLDTACRLAGQTPGGQLPAGEASEWVRVLTDPITDQVIAADSYRPTTSLRRYLQARDVSCRFPGCNRNTRHCDIDHTLAWEHGGTTTPENLAHLCRWHHTLKHHGGWTVKQTSPGTLEWTSPHGNLITTQPPPGPHFRNPEADPEPNPNTYPNPGPKIGETPPPF